MTALHAVNPESGFFRYTGVMSQLLGVKHVIPVIPFDDANDPMECETQMPCVTLGPPLGHWVPQRAVESKPTMMRRKPSERPPYSKRPSNLAPGGGEGRNWVGMGMVGASDSSRHSL